MGERPTIAFRVDESQKRDWDTYARKNEEYDSLSHLIRVAVAHEMSDQYGPLGRVEGGGGGGGGEQIGELVTAVEKMQGRLADVEKAVEDATEAAYSGGPTAQGLPPHGEILDAIPEGEDYAIPVEEIARRMDIEADTEGARMQMLATELMGMEENTGAIESFREGDQLRYYRED